MPLFHPKSKPLPLDRSGRWLLGLGLGGVAAAWGAVAFYRARFRPRSNGAAVSGSSPFTKIPASDPASKDWIAGGRSMDSLVPAAYSIPIPDPGPISSGAPVISPDPEPEPWIEALRAAMEKKPPMVGYDKTEWTAPLLGRYLLDTQGIAVPVPLLRSALKDLGYHWKGTHYAQARPGDA